MNYKVIVTDYTNNRSTHYFNTMYGFTNYFTTHQREIAIFHIYQRVNGKWKRV